MGGGGRDRSASSAKKGKKRKDRSRSRPEKGGKVKSKKSLSRSGSRSRKKKGRSRSAQKKRSPSRKRGRSKGKDDKKQQNRSEAARPAPAKPVVVKPPPHVAGKKTAADSPSPERTERRSPSYDRGSRSQSGGSRRSDSGGSRRSVGKQYEVVAVTLSERPFGMGPSKEEGVSGYLVSKVAESKPADTAGIQKGWQLVSIAGNECRDLDLESVQLLLKEALLPVSMEFEKEKEKSPPRNSDDDAGSDEEIDILDERAEYRMNHQSGMAALDDLPVKRSPEDLPPPMSSWQDACDRKYINKSLMDKLQAAGLKRPTLIQRHCIPIVSHDSGCFDMIVNAQTGSGKTFGFLVPTVGRLVVEGANPRPFFPGNMAQLSPLILILSPTRELAMQTSKEIEVMTAGTSLKSICIYGGESIKYQQSKIMGCQTDIICATPGRLLDLVDAGKVSLSFVQSIILDEADQMMAQSLEIIVAEILSGRDMPPPNHRQTLLFSATMPQKIRELLPKILKAESTGKVANLTVGHYQEDKGGACASIKQILRWVPEEKDRVQAMIRDLHSLWINQGRKGRVVIFTNQRLQAGNLANALNHGGISCVHLHGKLEQHVREEVFDKFRRGLAEVLVATNVASRGLDFPDISFVVQYNVPKDVESYTHRIGRTGRVGQVGCALSYVGPKDKHLFPKLVEFLELNKQEVPPFLIPRDNQRSPPRQGYGKGYGRQRSRSPPRRGGPPFRGRGRY